MVAPKKKRLSTAKHMVAFEEKYYARLGRIVAMFGRLELLITELIYFLAASSLKQLTVPTDDRVMLLFATEDFKVLLSKLKRIFEYCVSDPELLKAFKEIFDEATNLNQKRNEYIHTNEWKFGYWEGRETYRLKFLRKPTTLNLMPTQKVSLEELDTFLWSVENLTNKLSDLIMLNLPEILRQYRAKWEEEYPPSQLHISN